MAQWFRVKSALPETRVQSLAPTLGSSKWPILLASQNQIPSSNLRGHPTHKQGLRVCERTHTHTHIF